MRYVLYLFWHFLLSDSNTMCTSIIYYLQEGLLHGIFSHAFILMFLLSLRVIGTFNFCLVDLWMGCSVQFQCLIFVCFCVPDGLWWRKLIPVTVGLLSRSNRTRQMYSISQEICTRFLLCCALLWLYIDWFSHIHQAYFTGTVAI